MRRSVLFAYGSGEYKSRFCVPRVETSGAVVHLAVNDCGSPKERSLGGGYPQKRI